MKTHRVIWGLAAGLIFGIGLIVAGMADPAKVLNFLDILGDWDPSLAFVMASAVIITFVGYRLAWRRAKPVLLGDFDLPGRTRIDSKLVIGAALFGIGWGLGGLCPGPAFTAIALAAPGTLVFVPMMIIGILAGVRIRQWGKMARQEKKGEKRWQAS
ncbi:YeeE/YedE family protein [Consotaella salsifontis]|uniref:Sulphur transport domain-containing protein n=1 Tax=Consotaella salsifontis TaxID=1365950 RepID=A0A1T4PVR9_9HYPH|nr:YeeE/YedE family protein [Consotaella salsifontis]SJZ95559.1 hypothetical protein SAMN05428963_104191 [Consotaella salsifontis]